MTALARPALVTLALSAAAVLGFLAYRFIAAGGSEPPATSEPAESAFALVEQLPDFALDNLDGVPTSIRSWPGQPLVINFWATWCAPCRREIPMLKALQAEHEWLTVVGIGIDEFEPVREFARETEFNYPVLVGEAEGWAAAATFGVQFYALPFTVFAAGDGSVLGVHTGELHAEHLDGLVAVLADLRGGRIDVGAARARLAAAF